ncbi:MAG: hypothetical protein IPO58_03840 [Betaproteobacteria bacterium]|nr:hypothetical protein [Betaproteobacteria bacterium]
MSTTTNTELDRAIASDENRDPISGAPGAHPVGTGIGAALGGAAAGAAAGTVVGPVGTVVGAAVGAIVGGLAGKGVAEAIDPTRELVYWRENYKTRPYADKGIAFDEYEPAYGYGVASYAKYPGRSFDDLDSDLARDWNAARGTSTLAWDRARFASRDAWDRVSTNR